MILPATLHSITGKGSHAKIAARKLRESYVFPDPVEGARWIPLSKGKFALVDEADFELVSKFTWTAFVRPRVSYAMRRDENRRAIFLHRLIMGAPEGTQVDHEDFDGLNCRRYNLRLCTNTQNQRHMRKWSSPTSSRFKGVSWDKKNKKWEVKIRVNRQTIHLGRFLSEEDAAQKYNGAAESMFGDFAHLNTV